MESSVKINVETGVETGVETSVQIELNGAPNMPETLKAAETLVRDGFDVMVYCSDDRIQAKMLQMTELVLRCSNIITRLQVRNCGASRHNHCRPYAEVIDARSSLTSTPSYAWNWMRTGYTWAARMHRSHKFVP